MPMQTKGFSAWIEVEDRELEQFNTEILDDGKKATCWIASEVGKVSQVCQCASFQLRPVDALGTQPLLCTTFFRSSL